MPVLGWPGACPILGPNRRWLSNSGRRACPVPRRVPVRSAARCLSSSASVPVQSPRCLSNLRPNPGLSNSRRVGACPVLRRACPVPALCLSNSASRACPISPTACPVPPRWLSNLALSNLARCLSRFASMPAQSPPKFRAACLSNLLAARGGNPGSACSKQVAPLGRRGRRSAVTLPASYTSPSPQGPAHPLGPPRGEPRLPVVRRTAGGGESARKRMRQP